MYVGVTEADIAGEETNFVFSAFDPSLRPGVSILSYNRMMTKSTGEPFESRKRLTERIAKELVPASFKILNLPRAGDPTDPYSYSDGVARLDQKSLTLSDPVREALDKFR